MKDVNKVFLLGRLGGDPVAKETKNGSGMATFSLATSRKWKDPESEELREETDWHRIVTWGRLSEQCAKYLEKGAPVHVEGTIRVRKYEAKNGEERTMVEVHADEVRFLPKAKPADSTPAIASA
jgi:single-strand DNA-binding protein